MVSCEMCLSSHYAVSGLRVSYTEHLYLGLKTGQFIQETQIHSESLRKK